MYANPNTVYRDDKGSYTTNGFNPYERNYFNTQTQATAPTPSPINDLLARAQAASANVPTLQSLFPSMGMQGILGTPMQSPMANQTPMYNQFSFTSPSYGAGRFLGGNAMTSNAMNTTTGNTTT